MRRPLSLILAVGLLVGLLAAPASARWNREKPANVVEALVERSGNPNEFDRNGRDYDVLVAAALAVTVPGTDGKTTVADFLAGSDDITLWAPNDLGFVRTARDLGYDSWDESGVPAFLVGALGNDALFSVLAYHVTPDEFSVFEVLRERSFETLNGETIERSFLRLKDKSELRDPRLTWPLNLRTDGGVVHTINRVLLPF